MLSLRQCCQNLLFSSSTLHFQEDIAIVSVHLTACHSWDATINSAKTTATSKPACNTAALTESRTPTHAFTCCASNTGTRGRCTVAETHAQPHMPMYRGTTSGRRRTTLGTTCSSQSSPCTAQSGIFDYPHQSCSNVILNMQSLYPGDVHCS